MSKRKFLFIDRDGTLIHEPTDKQIDTLEKLQLEPDVIPSLLALKDAGYTFVMVSNQDGLGSPSYTMSQFNLVQEKLLNLFNTQGIEFEEILICPHWETDNCECRKPRLGLLLNYMAMEDIDRDRSVVIGDRQTDVLLAERMRLKSILYARDKQNWSSIVSQLKQISRRTEVKRQTNETKISIRLDLDETAPVAIQTSIGFFDHMLEQFARHAGISLMVEAEGDQHVDEHHLVEDTAIALGQALRQALGNKIGIQRYGFLLPMDEALAEVALDLSGRAYFVFKGSFHRESVGELPTELIPHFFRSLSEGLQAALHISVQGENDHHQIESIFKSVGRAFRQAKTIEGSVLPSTKGVL